MANEQRTSTMHNIRTDAPMLHLNNYAVLIGADPLDAHQPPVSLARESKYGTLRSDPVMRASDAPPEALRLSLLHPQIASCEINAVDLADADRSAPNNRHANAAGGICSWRQPT